MMLLPDDDPAQDPEFGDRSGAGLAVPATAPLLGPEGSLLYTGSDGRQYIVCGDPSQAEDQELTAAFQALRAGAHELDDLIGAARDWVVAARDAGLSAPAARRTLLGRLREALDDV